MAGYRPYPEYKDSGVEWLGRVPKHWDVSKTKLHFDIRLGKMLQPEPVGIDDEEVVYLKAGHVQWEKVNLHNLPVMWASSNEREKFRVENGDLLVCEGGEVGRSALLEGLNHECIIQNALHRVRPRDHTCTKYLNYLMRHLADADWFSILCNKATIAHLTGDKLGALAFPMPQFEEQQTIARFLDHKTTQIDALIAKKELLLKKLAEKRTALISYAVTKGLDPNVKMKDSGVEWLGQVPEHWDCVPFKWCCRIVEGQVNPVELGYSSQPLIAPNHIQGGTGKLIFVETAEEQGAISGKYAYKAGAVLYSKIRPALVKACIPDQDGLCSADMYPIYPDSNLLSEFLLFQILSKGFTQFALLVSDRVAMPKVNRETLGAFRISMPPLNEQKDIIKYLKSGISELDEHANKARETVGKLKEYRSALITQAVTGKIDVRNMRFQKQPRKDKWHGQSNCQIRVLIEEE